MEVSIKQRSRLPRRKHSKPRRTDNVEKLKALLQAKGIMLDMHHLWTAVKTLAAEVFGTPLRGPSHRTDTHA